MQYFKVLKLFKRPLKNIRPYKKRKLQIYRLLQKHWKKKCKQHCKKSNILEHVSFDIIIINKICDFAESEKSHFWTYFKVYFGLFVFLW